MKFKFVSLMAFLFVINVSAGHHEHGDHHAKDGKSKEWLIDIGTLSHNELGSTYRISFGFSYDY